MRVAFIGIGKMGLPMAGHLILAGHDVTVFNRTLERCDPLRDDGATVATSAAEAVRDAEVLVTMLADPAAVAALLDGEGGILAGAEAGLVWLEMSTIGPVAAREFAARAADAGIVMLDSPVSGGVVMAETADLVGLVGGRKEALEQALPVLEAMTKGHFHLGGSGAGAAMKLAVNMIVGAATVAVSEALVLAEAAGIERADAYDVIGAGAFASPFVKYKREAFLDPDGTPAMFALDLMRKDLGLALEQGEAVGLPLIGASASAEAMTIAAGLEGGDEDLVRVADALRRIAARPTADATN
ncbi:MAG TPA: NAD(P)-dependent oxidoreductase [Solirubrobacterales bacterium]